MEVFLEMFLLSGQTDTLLFLFALYPEIGFFTGFRKGFFVFHEIFEEFFLLTDLVET